MTRRGKKRPPRPTLAPHGYVPDGTKDHKGEDRCLFCRCPRDNRCHPVDQLPAVDDETRALTQRIVGEGHEGTST